MTESSLSGRRDRLERNAATLFVGSALVMAIVCGAIIVAGWFVGVIEDHAERVFWAGAILALLAIFVFAAAAFPGGSDDARVARRVAVLTRVGLVMFVSAPTLCIGALIADFYG
jgi:fucose permease